MKEIIKKTLGVSQVVQSKLLMLNHKRRGQQSTENGLMIAICVAIAGAILLVAFVLLKDTIVPELTSAVKGFFNFN